MSTYIGHVLLVCQAGQRAEAAQVAASITGQAADADPSFFSRALRPAGQAGQAPSHYMACTLATAKTVAKLPKLEQAFPGSIWALWWPAGEPVPRFELEPWLLSHDLELVPDPVYEV